MILHRVALGAGRPLVLLHGLFGRAANFATIQKQLAAHFRVLALDLRNHGGSPHAPDMDYVAQAADVLETLRHHAALPCALMGHSMGGKVAMAAALAEPDAIARLVVADIAPVRYPPHFRTHAAAMAALKLTPNLTRAAADAALAPVEADPRIRAFLLQSLRFGPDPAWKIGLSEIAAALPEIEDWPAFSAARYPGPALFLSGARSDYVRPEHRPAIRQWFPAARFMTLKNAGHWLHADAPDTFIAVLREFMR